MGWSYNTNQYQTKAEFKAKCIALCNWETDETLYSTSMSRAVGNHLWVAAQQTNKETGEKISYVTLFLMAKYQGCWGYKGMDESMHPYYYDCPQSVIDAVDPATHKSALEWRAGVVNHRERKKVAKQLIKSVQVGSVVKFSGLSHSYTVQSINPLLGFEVDGSDTLYRLPKARLLSVEPATVWWVSETSVA